MLQIYSDKPCFYKHIYTDININNSKHSSGKLHKYTKNNLQNLLVYTMP